MCVCVSGVCAEQLHGYNVNHFTALVNSHGPQSGLHDIEATVAALKHAGPLLPPPSLPPPLVCTFASFFFSFIFSLFLFCVYLFLLLVFAPLAPEREGRCGVSRDIHKDAAT
eukprot:2095556-Rhodomonas_salina.1